VGKKETRHRSNRKIRKSVEKSLTYIRLVFVFRHPEGFGDHGTREGKSAVNAIWPPFADRWPVDEANTGDEENVQGGSNRWVPGGRGSAREEGDLSKKKNSEKGRKRGRGGLDFHLVGAR